VLVILAPGQGAQTPGFLTPWLEVPGFEDRLAWLSAAADLDLVAHGTTSDAATIRDTAVAQPLIVASGLVSLLALFPHPADAFGQVGAGAGHSVGEITAAVGSGVLTAEQGMVLVRERGRAMAAASAVTPTTMAAVVGGDRDEVLAAIEQHGLTAANHNGTGQVVAAGTVEQVDALRAAPPGGVRIVPLSVAGAFHTHHMGPAVATLERYARSITTHDPRTRLLSNRDGAVVHDGRDALQRIVGQVASPVRWDLCMRTMADLGVTAVIELPPAGTLANLVKRNLPGVETLALKTPADLDAARRLVEQHGTPSPMSSTPTWRLLVAPSAGTWRAAGAVPGAQLEAGAAVGVVATHRDEHTVSAPHGGTVVELLVEDGDPVRPGQPLVRLHPEGIPA
jgi:[acyl-carrier-protein] S-malonyltransferase